MEDRSRTEFIEHFLEKRLKRVPKDILAKFPFDFKSENSSQKTQKTMVDEILTEYKLLSIIQHMSLKLFFGRI